MSSLDSKNFFFTVGIFLFSFYIFAKAQVEPLWVSDVYSVYNEKEFLAQVGNGPTEEIAKADALNNISRYLESKVQSESLAIKTFSTGTEGTKVSANIIQNIKVQSESVLYGVEFESFYKKKAKKYYSVALIKKSKFWEMSRPKIENKKNEFEKFYNEAEKLLSTSEPILAKKYFILSQKHGLELADLIMSTRLVVGDLAKEYSKDEKKVYSISKNIKDAENAITIYMEISGDFSRTVESKVKSLFEAEKYSFTTNKKNCSHIMTISIDQNKTVSGKGTDDEITTVEPAMTLTLTNPYENQNLFSFTQKAKKGIAYTNDVAMKKGFENLCKKLEEDLIETFQQKIFEE